MQDHRVIYKTKGWYIRPKVCMQDHRVIKQDQRVIYKTIGCWIWPKGDKHNHMDLYTYTTIRVLWPLLLLAENRPWNCQGRQFESQRYRCAENQPWNCQGRQCWKVAMKLPRSAVWEHRSHHGGTKWLKSGHETAKVSSLSTWPQNCQGRQFESTKKCVAQTAKVGSSMATFSNCPIWQVCPSVLSSHAMHDIS